jgi:tryptophan-rich sensory protein
MHAHAHTQTHSPSHAHTYLVDEVLEELHSVLLMERRELRVALANDGLEVCRTHSMGKDLQIL